MTDYKSLQISMFPGIFYTSYDPSDIEYDSEMTEKEISEFNENFSISAWADELGKAYIHFLNQEINYSLERDYEIFIDEIIKFDSIKAIKSTKSLKFYNSSNDILIAQVHQKLLDTAIQYAKQNPDKFQIAMEEIFPRATLISTENSLIVDVDIFTVISFNWKATESFTPSQLSIILDFFIANCLGITDEDCYDYIKTRTFLLNAY